MVVHTQEAEVGRGSRLAWVHSEFQASLVYKARPYLRERKKGREQTNL
jgi:hypothetical protein